MRLALNQWQATSWPLVVETVTPFWTSALLVIALSKLIDTGMPTPTVVPSSGVKVPMKLLDGETVVKEAFSWAARPSESSAVAVTL
ncbi:hypothetical protein SGRIM128S_06102 [Streptomyces griseomycini]